MAVAGKKHKKQNLSKFEYLEKIYQDLDHIAAYSGIDKLFKYVKEKKERKDIRKCDIKTFLNSMDSYTKHGLVPRRYIRRPFKISKQNSFLGMDLADMTETVAKYNDGFRYILVLMDMFSRKVFLKPLKNKTGANVSSVIDEYLHLAPGYSHINCDEGKEFVNSACQKIYDKYNVTRYNVFNRKFKCSLVERFIRTLKGFLFRHFTYKNTYYFLDVLPKFQKIYNSTPHKGLGYKTPDEVHSLTDLNDIKIQEIVQLDQKIKNYGSINKTKTNFENSSKKALKVGSHARILLNASERVFGKSYEKIFSDEIFTIRKVDKTLPISYWLEDLNGNPINGVCYREELKPVELPKTYYVEKVLGTRKDSKSGRTQYLVRWAGYSDDFNSYVDEIYKVK